MNNHAFRGCPKMGDYKGRRQAGIQERRREGHGSNAPSKFLKKKEGNYYIAVSFISDNDTNIVLPSFDRCFKCTLFRR